MIVTDKERKQIDFLVEHFGATQIVKEVARSLERQSEGLNTERGYGKVLRDNVQRLRDCAKVIEVG